MAASPPSCHRVLHWAVWTLAAGYALVQVYDCVTRFLAEPVSSHRDTIYETDLPVSAITLCNHIFDGPTLSYIISRMTDKSLTNLPLKEYGNETTCHLLDMTAV